MTVSYNMIKTFISKTLVLIVSVLPLSVSANIFPEWILDTPDNHAAYCVPVNEGLESARTAAIQFAKEELGSGLSEISANGNENVVMKSNHSEFLHDVEIVSFGEDIEVKVVEEVRSNQNFCILVTAK
ncbi:hypothetical protein BCT46_14850 [Vibrio sp. 10N.261.46.E8]|nr:hypothetical protein BH584_15300 [Vibrio sp. 10N.261.45.E1]PMJ27837.1 hypothetical protein BCU27_06505 [Vibrio sp. 10N.286.45.B6]PML88104.1 hypothetical protein BCT66_10935 [Vibrio sp. 10N.261.49.E11]PMM67432.1 hypothetical protein BCT48_15410 [Vibrio sp. 10N.261.46.F12]PMM81685.1 hypothetical protein BCT46_14850 [Vibrio sp. 10N.261.46.E8]PMN77947.1 hypothetical protein BCT22_20475 [Vibrio sp. 10N.261.45.A1]PMN91913.1 hypothetical protein BCT25_00800 [Vibrio sp. 10N.261.45.A6]